MFRKFIEGEELVPVEIVGDINRRIVSKYHSMLDLKGSKINFKPDFKFIVCDDIPWITGQDLYEVLEDIINNVSFDITLTRFGTFEKKDGSKVVCVKVDIPNEMKDLKKEAFKRIKYVGSDVEKGINYPYIEIATFKGKTPTLPKFEPQTVKIKRLKMIYKGPQSFEQYFI